MEIIIQPVLTGVNDNTLNDLMNNVSIEFEGIRVTLAGSPNDTTIGSKETCYLSVLT
jgi:hypothetical protein